MFNIKQAITIFNLIILSPLLMSSIISIQNAFVIDDISNSINSGNQRPSWTSSQNDDSWNYWWSYSGVSGPSYWGVLNLDWFMCDKGAKQSPINIETRNLIYDPNLKPLKIDNNLISGVLYNDGHAIVFNCSTMALILAQQSFSTLIKTKQQQRQSLEGEKILSNSDVVRNNNSLQVIKVKRSLEDDNQAGGLFSNFIKLNNEKFSSLKETYEQDLNDLSKSIDMSISQSVPTSSLSFLTNDVDNNDKSVDNNDMEEQQRNSLREFDNLQKIQISGAGLIYPFRFEAIYLRFGNGKLVESSPVEQTTNSHGSEHKINSKSYSGELQLIGYNSLLYKSYFEASTKPNGLLAIAILLELKSKKDRKQSLEANPAVQANAADSENEPLGILLRQAEGIKFRDESVIIRDFNLSALLPDLEHFVSYDGSLTTPGCHESVNWLILNKPLYITQSNLNILRSISADERTGPSTGTIIANNIRPIQPTNGRLIRTNIKPTVVGNNQNPETCQRLWMKYEYMEGRTKGN